MDPDDDPLTYIDCGGGREEPEESQEPCGLQILMNGKWKRIR